MAMMLRGHGSAIVVSRSSSHSTPNAKFSSSINSSIHLQMASRHVKLRGSVVVACSAVQETSTSTVAADESKAAKPAPKKAPAKTKAPVKKLPLMMEEDIIPVLKSILESQQDIADIELSFQDNKLEGSFVKKGNPYSFWAFFPDGILGPKGFSLSSYGLGASTVEPFLVDEKKVNAKLIVFWIEKRLAAQGIIPVWKD